MASDSDDIGYAVVGLGAGLWFFWHGFKELKLHRLISAMATSKVRSMAMGTVELAGTAHQPQALTDPIHELPCVYYNLKIEERRGYGKRSRWVKVYEDSSEHVPFCLKDDTGKILVLPRDADLRCDADINAECGGIAFFGSKNDAVERFMRAKAGSGQLHMEAVILRENDPLYVLGWAEPLHSPASLQETVRRRVKETLHQAARLLKADPVRMKAADVNSDGQVDAQEWDSAVQKLQEEIDGKEEISASDNPIVIRKIPEGLLVIADKHEGALASSIGRWAWIKITGGPILSLACAAYLFLRIFH